MKDQKKFLKELGLNPDAPNLVPETPAKVVVGASNADHRTIPAENIVFDPALLEGFTDLESSEVRNQAAAHIFAIYKSNGRDKPRNSLLWRRISQFIGTERLSRKTGGAVKEKIKTTSEQRDLAQTIAALGLTTEDLLELAKHRKEATE